MWLRRAARGAALAEQTRIRIERLGRTPGGHPLWTPEEDAILKANYPDQKALRKLLGHRPPKGCRVRANKLGIKTRNIQLWTAAEVSRLRKLYPHVGTRAELMQHLPNRRWAQITAKRNARGSADQGCR